MKLFGSKTEQQVVSVYACLGSHIDSLPNRARNFTLAVFRLLAPTPYTK